jgi:hypothetical protein
MVRSITICTLAAGMGVGMAKQAQKSGVALPDQPTTISGFTTQTTKEPVCQNRDNNTYKHRF